MLVRTGINTTETVNLLLVKSITVRKTGRSNITMFRYGKLHYASTYLNKYQKNVTINNTVRNRKGSN